MGYFFIFEVNKFIVKREMMALLRLQPRELTRLEVAGATHNPDLVRVEKHEIRYKGKMYDILREESVGDVTIFYCLRDHKEEMLISGFKKVNGNRYSMVLHAHLIKIALPLYLVSLSPPPDLTIGFVPFNETLRSRFLKIWSPPPELA